MIDHHHTKTRVGPLPTVVPTQPVFQHANHTGHQALWVVFVLMVISSAIFAAFSWKIPVSRRIFHIITTLTTIISALAYFAMASGDTSSWSCHTVRDHNKHVPDTHYDVCRQVYWARYVDWTLSSSLILFEMFLLAGTSGAHTLMGIVANVIMFISLGFSAFGRSRTAQTWGWFAISVVAYIFVGWHLLVNGTKAARTREGSTTKLFGSLASAALILWAVYIVIEGVATGARRTTVNAEVIIFGVLDVLTKAGIGLWLLIASRKARETFQETGGYWTHGFAAEGRIRITDSNGA